MTAATSVLWLPFVTISPEFTHRLRNSLVLCRLDYCNYILSGLPKSSLWPLQLALNTAIRLVFKSRRSCHVSPLLQNLSWLPIEKSTEGKILALTYKARNGFAPFNLTDLLNYFIPFVY